MLRNGLQDRVRVYLSDGLNGIPSSEKWDLVVSNPPHFLAGQPNSNPAVYAFRFAGRLFRDEASCVSEIPL